MLNQSVTIRGKLLALLLGTCTISLLVACVAFVVTDRRTSIETKQKTMTVLADAIAGSAYGPAAFGDVASTEYVLRTLASEATSLTAAVYQNDGALLAQWSRPQAHALAPRASELAHQNGVHDSTLYVTRPIKNPEGSAGTLHIQFSTVDIDARTRRFFGIAAAVLVGCLIAASLLSLRLHRLISDPVKALARAAERVRAEKDYSVRATKISSDEIGTLVDAFNEMLSGIELRDAELEQHRTNLEKLVDARTAELETRNRAMRIVLDNVEQGLATIQLDATLSAETSAAFVRWFGAPQANTTLGAHMEKIDPDLGLRFRLGWESITDDFLPWELSLEQMPHSFVAAGRHYSVDYRPILENERFKGALMVVGDVTESLEQAKREAAQKEALKIFECIMIDRMGFVEFLQEGDRLVDLTRHPGAIAQQELMRAVHTLKGNCAIFGVHSVAAVAHELEAFMIEVQTVPEAGDLALLQSTWSGFRARVDTLLGDRNGMLEIEASEVLSIVSAAESRAPHEQIARHLRHLTYESVQSRFKRIAERTQALASRLGKGSVVVECEAHTLRLPAERWAPFWSAFVHVIRNAVDHGLEPASDRIQLGKPPAGKVRLSCYVQDNACVIEVADDGRGIDWQRLAAAAKQRGLAHETHSDLVAALFADGVSTRDNASEVSGRGVGMAAVREATAAMGGRIAVMSEAGRGTTIRFEMPIGTLSLRPHAAA